jgi:poly-gamma-glutamate capsule biosynthesis protein CapA/YwtB (metallophosphatase superfamily)
MSNNIKIIAVGDISFTRDISKYVMEKKNGDYKYPLSYVKKYLKDSDISIANLETTITNKKKCKKSSLNFKSLPKCLDGLLDAGINLVNLANNHMNDYLSSGLHDTINILKKNNINIIGVKNFIHHIYKIKNLSIGFLGVCRKFIKIKNSNINIIDNNFDLILNQIRSLKKKADIIILSIHWGTEYEFKRNKNQYELSKMFIKNGVDIILGHHPHVIQDMAIIKIKSNNKIKKGYVFYSLGNFMFDSHKKKDGVRNTFILKIEIDKYKNIKFNYLPCIIYPQLGFVPVPCLKEFRKEFPMKSTKEANDLSKYIEYFTIKSLKKNNIKFILFLIFLYIYYKLK